MAGPSPAMTCNKGSGRPSTASLGEQRVRRVPRQRCAAKGRRNVSIPRLDPEYRDAVYSRVIRSFGDKRTEALFSDALVPAFQGVARAAKRKLEMVNGAARLDDLRVPPANRLEKLKGDLKDFYSIRVNDQWRVIFRWQESDAYEVRIVDYH